MKIKICNTLNASVVFGLQRGYDDKLIPLSEVKNAILKVQQEMKKESNVLLSVKITSCEIFFLGQDEPSVTLEFIQYPKFIYEEQVWIDGIVLFTKKLMGDLNQNRTVIVFPDKTMMLENSDKIDPRIKLT